MREFLWHIVARIACRRAVFCYLFRRAFRTPYTPITSRDGTETYMDRWWLFNPYSKDANGVERARWGAWLPSIRIHHIRRPDDDGAMHDHPWNARTIVLEGWYEEERPGLPYAMHPDPRWIHLRNKGYTGPVKFEQYHRISEVSPGGVFTLWFTWRYRGTWGFLVNGRKVPWREHLGE